MAKIKFKLDCSGVFMTKIKTIEEFYKEQLHTVHTGAE